MLTIDEAQEVLEEVAESLPEGIFAELNGGIILEPDAVKSEGDPTEELYDLGAYFSGGPLGRYVAIYYGSFCKVFEEDSNEVWRAELRETLLHELTHHIESLAGDKSLERWDDENMAWYLETGVWAEGGFDEVWDEEEQENGEGDL